MKGCLVSRAVAIRFAAAFALAALPEPVHAQRDQVMGSVTVAGPVDSLFSAFRAHLSKGNFKIERVDSTRRTIRFIAPESRSEAVVVSFASRGDSTLIAAQGVRGGMMATMSGLMAVHAMISPDSTRTPPARPHDTW